MADLLIKGMEIPENCAKCPFSEADYGYCTADIRLRDAGYVEQRPKWCPLVEIPTHGDLIDKGELLASIESVDGLISYFGVAQVITRVYDAPTVIEASEGGEQDA